MKLNSLLITKFEAKQMKLTSFIKNLSFFNVTKRIKGKKLLTYRSGADNKHLKTDRRTCFKIPTCKSFYI